MKIWFILFRKCVVMQLREQIVPQHGCSISSVTRKFVGKMFAVTSTGKSNGKWNLVKEEKEWDKLKRDKQGVCEWRMIGCKSQTNTPQGIIFS